jgi:inner membrane protein
VHPPTHALIGWGVANLAPSLDRRSRAFIFFASVVPDLDGLTIFDRALYNAYHRTVCHNALFAVGCAAIAAIAVRKGAPRLLVAGLVLLNLHLHFACDLLGSSGPDGSIWGIPYLQPFSPYMIDYVHQWGLRSWQNVVITLVALAWTVQIARKHGRSPVEPFSLKVDAAVVEAIRRRFGSTPPALTPAAPRDTISAP